MISQVICRYVSVFCTVVRSSLLSRLTKQSTKGSFPVSSISSVNWMSAFCSVRQKAGRKKRQYRLCERR